jgi:preprotein translocase subunit SecF
MELFKTEKIYNLMAKRVAFLSFSSILVIASIILLLTKGLNFGIDFAGGTIVQVKYEKAAPIDQLRDILKETKYSNAVISEFGTPNEVVIRITGSTSNLTNDIGDEMNVILAPTGKFEIRRVDMVGPKVGGELREKGLKLYSSL